MLNGLEYYLPIVFPLLKDLHGIGRRISRIASG
jgi:hypothetical protein